MSASKTATNVYGPRDAFVSVDKMSFPGTENMMAQTAPMQNLDLMQTGLANISSNKAPVWMFN